MPQTGASREKSECKLHVYRLLRGFQKMSPLREKQPIIFCAMMFFMFSPTVGSCFDFGSVVDDVGNAVKRGMDAAEKSVGQMLPQEEQNSQQDQNKGAVNKGTTKQGTSSAKSSSGKFGSSGGSVPGTVFSASPINPDNPAGTKKSFKAGDNIYGMLKGSKSWKDLVGSSNYLIIYFFVDGKQKVYKSVGLRRPDLLSTDYFIIDITPDPAKMTNYSDRDIVFPEKDGYKFGPELFTKYLSELSPGDHTIRLEVKAYNKIYAAGEFSISGDDFSVYTALLEDIKAGVGSKQMMPKIGMTDVSLQDQMKALLKNNGWPKIQRLVIVDKDWWLDRVSGGDSPLKSRHIEAAAAAKDSDGSYYFSHVTFHQPMLITGDWGKLELTRTEKKKPILKENINK